ncbi:MAG: endopeptidase La, partial [Bdellovibrionales bacterium]|nr:endopeptidase La [Bdellovibrionales bacterium]
LVAFPSVMMSFYVGRPESISAVEMAAKSDNLLFILAQKDETLEEPTTKDLYDIGVVANVVRALKLGNDRYKLLIQGLARARVKKFYREGDLLRADIESVKGKPLSLSHPDVQEVIERIQTNLHSLIDVRDFPDDLLMVIEEADEVGVLADLILAHLREDVQFSQGVLEELDAKKRIHIVDQVLQEEISKAVLENQIRDRAQDQMSKGQREYFLMEQLKQIKQELGDSSDDSEELSELKSALSKAKLPALVEKEATKQLKRLERMHSENSDASLLRTYLEWISDLPWAKRSRERLDLNFAREVLEEEHYGLDKVKDRILEFLSVRKLNRDSKGPILCLVGPPGVGKTSLGRSVARALNREFVRISLGGMRDEAEIRGHRRTYVGALPGRIIQSMKQAGTKNPVFVLDELDKIGADFRGDPAAALLEVLDPEQNKEFSDHYLNVPFDLSEVMFFATANTTDTIPGPLLDRIEVIRIAGYTTQEKLSIAKRYLIPRQLAETGLEGHGLSFADKGLYFLIERYTREAGVRNLEREIGSLCRKIARRVAEKKKAIRRIGTETIVKLLGPTRFEPEFQDREDGVGVVTGLAWTVYGGDTLIIEASVAKGKGNLALTGQLGEVMQESAQAAVFFARSNAEALGLDPNFHEKYDIHIHVPAGATPKDGPSAGVTIATALVSCLSGVSVPKDLGMTGEITLRGSVLPVGGIKEKALAALRYGVKRIIIPADNVKDLEDIPKDQRKQIEFIPVKFISEVLEVALNLAPAPGLDPSRSKRRGRKIDLPIQV